MNILLQNDLYFNDNGLVTHLYLSKRVEYFFHHVLFVKLWQDSIEFLLFFNLKFHIVFLNQDLSESSAV